MRHTRRHLAALAVATIGLISLPHYADAAPAPHILTTDADGRPMPGGGYALYDEDPATGAEPIATYVGIRDDQEASLDPLAPFTEYAAEQELEVGGEYWIKETYAAAQGHSLTPEALHFRVITPTTYMPLVDGEPIDPDCADNPKKCSAAATKETPDGIYSITGSYVTIKDARTGTLPHAGGIGLGTVGGAASLVIMTSLGAAYTARPQRLTTATPAAAPAQVVPKPVQAAKPAVAAPAPAQVASKPSPAKPAPTEQMPATAVPAQPSVPAPAPLPKPVPAKAAQAEQQPTPVASAVPAQEVKPQQPAVPAPAPAQVASKPSVPESARTDQKPVPVAPAAPAQGEKSTQSAVPAPASAQPLPKPAPAVPAVSQPAPAADAPKSWAETPWDDKDTWPGDDDAPAPTIFSPSTYPAVEEPRPAVPLAARIAPQQRAGGPRVKPRGRVQIVEPAAPKSGLPDAFSPDVPPPAQLLQGAASVPGAVPSLNPAQWHHEMETPRPQKRGAQKQ